MTPAEVFKHYWLNKQIVRNEWLTWVEPIMCHCVRNRERENGPQRT